MKPIPLIDLRAQYDQIEADIRAAFDVVFTDFAFINGPHIKSFEASFSQVHDLTGAHAVGVSNGTSALTVALKAFGLKQGAEVILPSHTFFATAESVLLAGYKPVFADIKSSDYTLDPAKVEELITPLTGAIIPVHIYGNMADMDALGDIAAKHELMVLEDAAQAHLASWNGQLAGTFGDAGTYSFYPSKNLGAYGDAGLVLTKHKKLADRIRKFIDHGREERYIHDVVGDNLRIDTLQAAFLEVKLKHLPNWTNKRRINSQKYDRIFKPAGFKVIELPPQSNSARHLYILEVDNRDATIAHLHNCGIASMIHYPVPLHLQPALQSVDRHAGDLRVTEAIAERILTLPMFPELTDEQIERIGETVIEIARV